MLLCNSKIPSALAQEKEVHFGWRNFLDMLGSERASPWIPGQGHPFWAVELLLIGG